MIFLQYNFFWCTILLAVVKFFHNGGIPWRGNMIHGYHVTTVFQGCVWYNSWSKSARSLKYSPHWGALQDFEWTNAKIFTTQQLSKLWLISKSFAKELVNTKMNNILKFHQNPLTINACHIKIKFKLKLGWGFSQRGMDQSQMWSTAHTAACGRKALINNCTYNFGQNKSGKWTL